jgi:AFG3 family protein
VYGMSEILGPISFQMREGEMHPYGEETASKIDKEVRQLIDAAYQRCTELLTKHRENLTKVAELLMEKETIGTEDLVRLLGERPWPIDSTHKEYLDIK